MGWDQRTINNHLKAAKRLEEVVFKSSAFIKKGSATEYGVQQYILKLFKAKRMDHGGLMPIVAFGKNTSFVHYFPSQYSRRLKNNTLILIDVFGKLKAGNSPFADITWMLHYGKNVGARVNKIFNLVLESRDLAVKCLKNSLLKGRIPTGADLDKIARNHLDKSGYAKNFLHSLGHPLGFSSPHGKEAGLRRSNFRPLKKNLGYTIEPGVYLKNNFGVRSEINFYINNRSRLVVTTKPQKKLIII